MKSSNRQKRLHIALGKKQRGAALILLAFIIGLAVTALLMKSFNATSLQAEREERTMQTLMQAKKALLAWSIAHPNWPGVMPFPDRNGDGDYDGESDCVTSGLNTTHLLGKLPLLGEAPCITPQDGLGIDAYDSSGEKLWYAVSMNLIRTSGSAATPVINPRIIDNPTNSWMVLRDSRGAIISDRVAVVILAPGSPVSPQDRSEAEPPPADFLDQIIIGGTTYSNFDYDTDDEDFIMGDTTTGNFNDKLVYITIDELMTGLEKRAANTAKEALNNYEDNSGNFPYAAPLGITRGYSCKEANNAGLLPLDDDGSCNYSFIVSNGTGAPSWWPSWFPPWIPAYGFGVDEYTVLSTCNFDEVERVRFTRTSGANYTSASPNCIANGLTCTCTGAGSCSAPNVPTFSCDATGNCNSTSHQRNENSMIKYEGGYFSSASGACSPAVPACEMGNGYPVQCTATNVNASGTFTRSCSETPLTLPDWFKANLWQDYFYYRTSRGETENLTSGDKDGLEAILIATGAPLSPSSIGVNQNRASCVVVDYLDSTENTGGELLKFDSNNMPKSTNYNDRVYIVAP